MFKTTAATATATVAIYFGRPFWSVFKHEFDKNRYPSMDNSDLDEWTRQMLLMVNWDPASPNEVGL